MVEDSYNVPVLSLQVEGFLGLLSETRCFVQEECMRAVQGAVIHLGEHQGGEACRSLFLDQLDASALESEEEEELTPDRFFEENKQVIRRLLETHQVGWQSEWGKTIASCVCLGVFSCNYRVSCPGLSCGGCLSWSEGAEIPC